MIKEEVHDEHKKVHGTDDVMQKKLLEDNRVFADVYNTLLFSGKAVIRADSLESTNLLSFYGTETRDQIFKKERDVAKRIKDVDRKGTIAGCLCIENQSHPSPVMPYRIIGYDAASYAQWLHDVKLPYVNGKSKNFYTTITLVLNYGKQRWGDTPRSLTDIMMKDVAASGGFTKLEKALYDVVDDYTIKVYDISWLSEKQLLTFKSRFRFVADFLVGRRTGKYLFSNDPIDSEDLLEIAMFINAVSDEKYFSEEMLNKIRESGKTTMTTVLNPFVEQKVEQKMQMLKRDYQREQANYQREQAEKQAKEKQAQAQKQAKSQLASLERLVTKFGLTEEQAMDALGITEADVESYKNLIAENNDQK